MISVQAHVWRTLLDFTKKIGHKPRLEGRGSDPAPCPKHPGRLCPNPPAHLRLPAPKFWTHLYKHRRKHRCAVVAVVAKAVAALVVAVVAVVAVVTAAVRGSGKGGRHHCTPTRPAPTPPPPHLHSRAHCSVRRRTATERAVRRCTLT